MLKPPWSPELCLSRAYTGRPTAVRREAAAAAGGIPDRSTAGTGNTTSSFGWPSTAPPRVVHVAEVLCHRAEGSTDRAEPGDGAVVAALAREGRGGHRRPAAPYPTPGGSTADPARRHVSGQRHHPLPGRPPGPPA